MAYHLSENHWTLKTNHGSHRLIDVVQGHARPFYLYDLEDAVMRAKSFMSSGLSVHYALKANSDPRLMRLLAAQGMGVDVVSLGELQKAIRHGFSPQRLIFSGVAKDSEEIDCALHHRVLQINVESFEELKLIHERSVALGTTADVALRLNIHLTAPTHAHVQTSTPEAKFGIDVTHLNEVLTWLKTKPQIRLKGIATHIGSQVEDMSVFAQMSEQMGQLYAQVQRAGFSLQRLDLGGGLGIDYHADGQQDEVRLQAYLKAIMPAHKTDAQVSIEPGRFVVARMGVMLAKVIYVKKTSAQQFAILNAGMNFLMRPALYDSYHRISPLVVRPAREKYTVVGPICETTDKFAVNREMGQLERGDWVAVFDSGAYGATMANTYNESLLPEQWSLYNGEWEVH